MKEQKIISCFLLTVLLAVLAIIGFKINPAMIPFEAILFYATAFFLLYCLVFNPKELPLPKVFQSGIFIIIAGILLRLAFLGYPMSDDVNRYAWEGLIQSSGINPYVTAPAALQEEYARDLIYRGINHPNVSAIYPPVALLTFRVIASLSYELMTFKVFFIVCDMLTLFCLWSLLKQWKQPSRMLMLYAFNPLVLLYGAGEGHLDVLMILYLAIALLCFNYAEKTDKKWVAGLAYFTLGLAVMTKLLPVILLPFLMTRKNVKFCWTFLLPLTAYLWFIQPGMFQGLQIFAGEMAYNGFFMKPLILVFGNTWARTLSLILCAAGLGMIWLFFQERPRERAMLYAYFWCLLCLPCLHIWYLMPLALLMLRWPSRSIMLLMLTAGGGFFVQHYMLVTGQWREFAWLWPVTYLPPLMLLLYDRLGARLPWQRTYRKINSCDVIIPVLNEAENLPNLLASLNLAIEDCDRNKRFFRAAFSIIFVDGGSSDQTRELLTASRIGQIVAGDGGRGNQFAAGIRQSDGDLIIMLHADAVLNETAISHLLSRLNKKPHIAWGILQHKYDTVNMQMRWVQVVNILRFRLLGIAFGDQGIFVRREALEAVGGMPEIALMEDVELSQKLSLFPAAAMSPSLTISSRRWRKMPFIHYAIQVFSLVSGYLLRRRLGQDIDRTAREMYQKYYGKSAS
jgi:Glycosyl transferase family 2